MILNSVILICNLQIIKSGKNGQNVFCPGRFFPGFFRRFFPLWKNPDNPGAISDREEAEL